MEYGSQPVARPSRTRVTLAATAQMRAVLKERSEQLEIQMRHSDLVIASGFDLDVKAIHQTLFHDLSPDLPGAIATFRGEKGSVLESAVREVRVPSAPDGARSNDPCLPPHDVARFMSIFQDDLKKYWGQLPRDPIPALAELTHRFFHIHPFIDGNGHVWRACMIVLFRRAGLSISTTWQIDQRPYGVEFSHAIQMFERDPSTLTTQLASFVQ